MLSKINWQRNFSLLFPAQNSPPSQNSKWSSWWSILILSLNQSINFDQSLQTCICDVF